MKFTLAWLKDHLETSASAEDVADRLTMIGFELESITDRAAGLQPFKVARIVDARPHPQADKLRVCTVDTGGETVTVVCGAPNARAGLKGVFAPPGSVIPGTGLELAVTAIRGVASHGMLLSEREMRLSDEHAGIVELPDDAVVGARAVDVMGLGDPVLDVSVTPNRGDCLSVRGLARELAAAGVGTLKPLDARPIAARLASPITVRLSFADGDGDACPQFVGRYLRGVGNGPAPAWMRRRLEAVGLRPISALVDITNYMTLDLCRPLHVFDADKVRGGLDVRLARPGETLLALNGREYVLDTGMTVIADDHGVEALGGVMGGLRSGCTEETVNVFVESALFDPVRTAATGRKLNLASDARYRFERGIDPRFLVPGIEIATRLILELCGGEASELVVVGREPPPPPRLTLRTARLRSLGGVDVPPAEASRLLSDLGFSVAGGNVLDVEVPSWRSDVVGEACLVEEVVRLIGYDRIDPVALDRTGGMPRPVLTAVQSRRALVRRVLAARGLSEAVSFSFLSADVAEAFGPVPASLRLVNPISTDLDTLRPSILPNLLTACARNAARGFPDVALFEVGPQYAGDRPEDQSTVAAGVRCGQTQPRHWAATTRAVDVFDAKADAFAVLEALGASTAALSTVAGGPSHYHPGRVGTVRGDDGSVLAIFGELHPRLRARFDIAAPAVAFEAPLTVLNAAEATMSGSPFRPAPFQPVERDFAFAVDAEVPAEAVLDAVRAADPVLIREVRLFDVFSGENVGAGRKSLAVTVVLQATERTLTDRQLEDTAEAVVASVHGATGGTLRG